MHSIVKLGNPKLRIISENIKASEFGTNKLHDLSKDLFDIMLNEKGVGLAAPQIGLNIRALVFGLDGEMAIKRGISVPFTVLFNPTFEPIGTEKESAYEGCLSVGEIRGIVPRYKSIYYVGYDGDGNRIEREVSGLHARVFQHEYDHLDGIVFLDRVEDTKTLGFHEELLACHLL